MSSEKHMPQDMTTGSIGLHIRHVAIPASVGFFFQTMFNVTDTWFAGRMSTDDLAALSLSFPLFFIIISVGNGMATGATALIGQALGSGNREEAAEYGAQALTFGVLISIILAFVGIWSSPYLFRLLGASERYLGICLAYMKVIFAGSLFFMLQFMANSILNALGNTRPNRNFLIVASIANIIMDPWFIWGGFGVPAMGIAGVGLATVLCQAGGAVYLISRALRAGLLCGPASCFIPKPRVIIQIARQGVPAAFNLATIGIGIFILTYYVSRFGQEAVAAYGAAVRVEQIVLLPSIGLNIATLSIASQNAGAGHGHRVKEVVSKAIRYGGWMMLGGCILLLITADYLMQFFTPDPVVQSIGAGYLRVDALVLWGYVILFVSIAALQGMKRPMFALWIGLYRQIVAPIIVFQIFIVWLDFDITAIWWGFLAITWSAALIARMRIWNVLHSTYPNI